MPLQALGTPISLSQIQTEFGGANPISLSEYYRSFEYVPVASTNSIPASGSISLSGFYNTFRSGFRIMDEQGRSWKYDDTTQQIRLITGTEMQFVVASNSRIFNSSVATAPRFGLSNILANTFVCLNTSTSVYKTSNVFNNNGIYAFRFISPDNGASYNIFNDTFTNLTGLEYNYVNNAVVKNQAQYDMFPYTQTLIAYDSNTDVVKAVSWKDARLPRTWYIDNTKYVSASNVNASSNLNTYILSYPPGPFVPTTSVGNRYTSVYTGWLYGNGTYSLNVSQTSAGRLGYFVFNFKDPALGNLADGWQMGSTAGDWIEITFPNPIKIKSYILDAGSGTLPARAPNSWIVTAYQPNSSTSNVIDTATRSGSVNNRVIANPLNAIFFDKIRLTVTSVPSTACQIPELRFFGTLA